MRLGDRRMVHLGDVERELRRAWEALDEESCRIDGVSVLRLRELNLVVMTDLEGAERARSIAARTVQDHPGRVIVIVQDGVGSTASIATGCMIDPRSGREVCGEEIVLESAKGQEGLIRSALARLLVPDLPAALWWSIDPLADPSGLRALSDVVDRVVIDLAMAADLAGALAESVSGLNDDSRVDLRELEWLRIAPWRELVAGSFERADRRRLARCIERVEVTHANAPAQALLLAGWVASRLGCALGPRGWEASKESLALGLAGLGRPTSPEGLEICVSEAQGGEERLVRGLVEVRIQMRETLDREDSGEGEGSVRVAVIKSAGAAYEDDARLLSIAVSSSGRDSSLEASLFLAAKLAGAPGSAWSACRPSRVDATGADGS